MDENRIAGVECVVNATLTFSSQYSFHQSKCTGLDCNAFIEKCCCISKIKTTYRANGSVCLDVRHSAGLIRNRPKPVGIESLSKNKCRTFKKMLCYTSRNDSISKRSTNVVNWFVSETTQHVLNYVPTVVTSTSRDPYAAPLQLNGCRAGEKWENSCPGHLLPCSWR